MDLIALPIAVFAALATPPAAIGGAASMRGPVTPAVHRSSGGAVGIATVTVRIIANSARIGAGFAPPLPEMTPRAATITAANGGKVGALIYDFE